MRGGGIEKLLMQWIKTSVLQDEKVSRCYTTIQIYLTVLNWWLRR